MPVCQVDGVEVRTVEGLAGRRRAARSLDPLQQAFLEAGGAQCGICTPGMLMAARAYLDDGGGPDEGAIREAIAGQPLPLHGLHEDRRGDRDRSRRQPMTNGRTPTELAERAADAEADRQAALDNDEDPRRIGRRRRRLRRRLQPAPGRRRVRDHRRVLVLLARRRGRKKS